MKLARICLDNLEMDALLGVHTHELSELQTIQVSVQITVDVEHAAQSEKLKHTVDYAQVAEIVRFLLGHCRYRLLETGAQVLLSALLAPPANTSSCIQDATVTLRKPGALDGFGLPSLQMTANPAEIQASRSTDPCGVRYSIHEGKEVSVYRLDMASGATLNVAGDSVSFMPLDTGISLRDEEIKRFEAICCGEQDACHVLNTSPRCVSVFVIERRYDDRRFDSAHKVRAKRNSSIFPMF